MFSHGFLIVVWAKFYVCLLSSYLFFIHQSYRNSAIVNRTKIKPNIAFDLNIDIYIKRNRPECCDFVVPKC